MSDGEVDPQKHKPVPPPAEEGTPEYVPTHRSGRSYLWLGETAEDLLVGPVNTRVQVGDIILVQAQAFQEQWAAVVDSIDDYQMARVTRQ